jgi:N6-L-threonylcarbamoyladenine synthase
VNESNVKRELKIDGSTVVLGIETSCDETAAALVMGGNDVLSSVVASQLDVRYSLEKSWN